jgi:hypothetical protein
VEQGRTARQVGFFFLCKPGRGIKFGGGFFR